MIENFDSNRKINQESYQRPELSEQRDQSENAFILDIHKNSAALATLRLLGQFGNAQGPVSEAEIIEKRTGGIYPTRTVEEIQLLKNAKLIERVSENPSRFIVSPFGKMELSLNNIIGPERVKNRLNDALKSLIDNPPHYQQRSTATKNFDLHGRVSTGYWIIFMKITPTEKLI